MATFEIGGQKYQSAKMAALPAFHVARRIMPAVAPLFASLPALQVAKDSGRPLDILSVMVPLMEEIAKMPDKDVDEVIAACLAVVTRQQPNGLGWAPVWSAAGRQPMFDDITLPVMLGIVAQVLRENLESFSAALPSVLSAAPRQG